MFVFVGSSCKCFSSSWWHWWLYKSELKTMALFRAIRKLSTNSRIGRSPDSPMGHFCRVSAYRLVRSSQQRRRCDKHTFPSLSFAILLLLLFSIIGYKMINAVLVFNNNGQARLTKFYTQIVSSVHQRNENHRSSEPNQPGYPNKAIPNRSNLRPRLATPSNCLQLPPASTAPLPRCSV